MRKSKDIRQPSAQSKQPAYNNPFTLLSEDYRPAHKAESQTTKHIQNSAENDFEDNRENRITDTIGPPTTLMAIGPQRAKLVLSGRKLISMTDSMNPSRKQIVMNYVHMADKVLLDPTAGEDEFQQMIPILKNCKRMLTADLDRLLADLRKLPQRLSPAFVNKKNTQTVFEAFLQEMPTTTSETWGEGTIRYLMACTIQSEFLIRYTQTTEQTVRNSWKALSKRFGWGKTETLKAIYLTGSDFHNFGKTVCIIETSSKKKTVFKPRDMRSEMAVSDSKRSFFTNFNKIAPNNLPLPTQSFLPKSSEGGFTQFIDSSSKQRPGQLPLSDYPFPILNREQETFHFMQLGQMAVFSKLLGILDLHFDNIMTVNKGFTFMIDNEAVFQPNFIADLDNWTDNSLAMCIKTVLNSENIVKFPANFYLTEDDNPLLIQYPPNSLIDIFNLQEALEGKRRAEMHNPSGRYWRAVEEGITIGINKLKATGRKRFIAMIDTHLASIDRVRFIPVKTDLWKNNLENYYRNPEADDKIEASVTAVFTCIATQKSTARMTPLKLGLLIREDFERHDIPIFQLAPKTGNIFYHDQLLAVMDQAPDLKTAMIATFDALISANPKKLAATVAKKYFNTNR